jgi:hypothetical protein
MDALGMNKRQKNILYRYHQIRKTAKETFVPNNVFNKIASKLSSAQFTSANSKITNYLKINNPNTTQSKEEFSTVIFILSSGWTVV